MNTLRLKITTFCVALAALIIPIAAHAASAAYRPDEYYRADVVAIDSEGPSATESGRLSQTIEAKIKSGNEMGKVVKIIYDDIDPTTKRQKVAPGDSIIVIKTPGDNGADVYYISDFYRMPALIGLAIVFFAAVFAFGRTRGITSLLGLVTTVGVLLLYIIPQIIAGHNPMTVVLIGAPVIICLSMFLAHGFNRQTVISVISTGAALVFAIALAYGAVVVARMFGTGSEEAMYVQGAATNMIDLQGVLLAGIIIGTLGVLDDITTAQTAAAFEIFDTKPNVQFKELFMRVMRVGREHIASLVNTLVLAYAGASFPLLLLFYTNKSQQPLWVVLNSQQIAEEIVRTLVGSTALVVAVPISTAFAAWVYTRSKKTKPFIAAG